MCYSTYFSTTCDRDLASIESDHFIVRLPKADDDEAHLAVLAYPNRWYLSSRFGGCSCHYRHAFEDLGFGPPVDWYSEEAGNVEATRHVYDLFHEILSQGHQLDILDVWSDTPVEDVHSIEVALRNVPRDHFRFLEDVHMRLTLE